jgi:hypothetical protein
VGVADQVAVSSHAAALLLANVLMLLLGCGLLPFLRLARSRRELVTRAPLGYAVGLAATGILAADLAVVHVAVGRLVLPVLALGSLGLGLWRTRGARGERFRRPGIRDLVPLGVLALTLLLLVPAVRLFAVKPLLESDGWWIWGVRARALYDFGYPAAPVFTDPVYAALQHPLLLPALEAVDFRFMGAFDGTTVHLQLVALAAGFVGGAWVLLRRTTRPLLLASTLLALLAVPSFFHQLETNYADIPLAMFTALGVAALATWLRTGDDGLLPAAGLFLAAAALTKNEGETFALTALVAALLVSRRTQVRPLLLMAGAVLLADLPWRLWLQLNHVRIAEYSLSNLADPSYLGDHSDRLRPAAVELWTQLWSVGSWSYLVRLILFALAAALVLRRFRPALFGLGWLLLSFAGLVAIYWISTNPLESHLANSSDRTIDSLVLAAGLLVPVLLYDDRAQNGPRGT